MTNSYPSREIIRGACPHDCPDTCAMLTTVCQDKAVAVQGNPDYPFTQGTLCGKVDKFLDRVYSPERVLYPLRRVGIKGKGQFERISWDAALSEIVRRYQAIAKQYGTQAILPCSYLGQQGLLNGLAAGDAFFNRLGASICERTLCNSGTRTAYMMTYGATPGTDPDNFIHAQYIILWACNAISTNLHLWSIISQARRQGAKLVVIDPFRTRTAKQADWHLQIRPGTDAALALGMIHVIFQENLLDPDYVENYTVGAGELRARAREYPPERVAAVTGIPVADISQLARNYATIQPSVIRLGVALERQTGGGQAVRAICCLPSLVGAWRQLGGGLLQVTSWCFPIKWDALQRPDLMPSKPRVINMWQLGSALAGKLGLDPPIQALFVYNCNPVVMLPEQEQLLQGLERDDLFVVVSEQFMTDITDFADIVLPATTQVEQFDLMYSWGHLYLNLNLPAIKPLGEAVPNVELFRRLAARIGFKEACFQRSDEQIARESLDWSASVLQGADLDLLKRQGFIKLQVDSIPHAAGNFATASGKCEFLSSLAAQGNFVLPFLRQGYKGAQAREPIDPLPTYTPPQTAMSSTYYPLKLLSAKAHALINSSYGNLPRHQRMEGESRVIIHPQDAAQRQISTGEIICVFNQSGSFQAIAQVSDDVLLGVIVVPIGHWRKFSRAARTLGAVAASTFADLGRAATVSDTLVEVTAAFSPEILNSRTQSLSSQ